MYDENKKFVEYIFLLYRLYRGNLNKIDVRLAQGWATFFYNGPAQI